jgi:NAD(P)-dependent dehydrogenase (short-subunit alcohol dehydrogenase family)
MGRLDGKVALISGGAKGQGAVEARMFTAEGAKVVLGDILDDQGAALEKELRATGADVTYVHLDVTQESDWQNAVEVTERTYGKLNVLINNAGILILASLEETTEEQWDRIMAVNVKGVFLGTKAALPAMRRAGGGSIVNLSSTAGLVGGTSSAMYTSSKGAVRLFTKATAMQTVKDNIRCNSVHPGPIETDMIAEMVADEAGWQARLRNLPMGRAGKPEEVVYGVMFLASDESSYMTGSELVIDGGTTAQ